MAVRMSMPWWGRVAVMMALAAVVGGMWWWGFDFGQIFGGFNRKEIEARMETLETEAGRSRADAAEMRSRTSQLESDLAMSRGAEQALSKQASDLAAENAQLKEETTFLQKLVSDSSKQAGLAIPRLSVEVDPDGAYRYNLLVVRGGSPKDEFEGHVTLQASVSPADGSTTTLTLPDDQPGAEAPLGLHFKYYQRIEGTLKLPPGSRLTALTARAYENGDATPRVTRTLSNP
jgi:Family of unknown function (DUF6776)